MFEVIDVNAMIGTWSSAVRFTDETGLISSLDTYQLRSAVTFHSAARLVPAQYNQEMSRIAAASGGRIAACHVLDPAFGAGCEAGTGTLIARLRQNRPAAVRLFPANGRYPLTPFYCGELLDTLNQLRLPLLLDFQTLTDLALLPELIAAYPDLPFVLLRIPLNNARVVTPLLNQLPNVYADASILIDTGYLEELVLHQELGSRLVFGSGLPLYEPSGGLALILYATIDDAAKQAILAANWRRLQEEIRYDHP